MRSILVALALCLASPAHATGGFGCEVDDANAKIDVYAMTTRGMGFPVQRIDGTVDLRGAALGDDLRVTRLDAWSLPQYWAEDDELRFFAYLERTGEPHGYVKLIVRTRFDEADDLVGRYEIEALDMRSPSSAEDGTIRIEGDITCMLE